MPVVFPFFLLKPVAWLSLHTDLVREQTGLNSHGYRMVLLLSRRELEVQLLQDAL